VFGLLLCCTFLLGGCFFLPITDKDVPGTYKANAQWGDSALVLYPDHTFDQTVLRNDHTQIKTKGTWELDLHTEHNISRGMMVFTPFLDVEHDSEGELVGGAFPSISRGFLWGVTIASDPDYGISFDKN
jgi:hypothetical protein